MLPNGQQQINVNKDAGVFSGGYQYPFMMSGQPIMMAPNGVPYLVQPVYNLKPAMQGNNLSATSHLPQPRQEKKQLKSFANFTSSGTKNADEMIRSIIVDSKSLIDDVPTKSINKHTTKMTDNVNNNIVTTSMGYNFGGIQFPHNHYSTLSQGMSLAQNSTLVPTTFETKIDEEDEFGDFVGVHLEVGKSLSTAEAPHIHPPPLHVPSLVSSAQSFAPVTAGISESVDEFSLYGIQMPRWITNERHVPEVYNQVFNSVTRNGGIDTELLHSELLKSGLPREVLGYLWELCNRRLRGKMDRCELFLMLAMISIYQNKMDCSSLYILTKCPQAPIPKLDVIGKSKVSLENSYTSSINNPKSAFSIPLPSKLSVAPSTAIPAKNHCDDFIGDFINLNKTLEAFPSMSDEKRAECLWESSEVIVRRNNQQNNCEMEYGNNNKNVKLITSDNDDEFDDFKSAPGAIDKPPRKKAISSSIVRTQSPPLQPQAVPKKPPTLLSLASPVLSNPPSSLYPSSSSSLSFSSNQDYQIITTELNSIFGEDSPSFPNQQISPSSYHQNSPAPDVASDKFGDKYAVFRELQLAEQIPDRKHEDEEFGEFETSPEMLSSSTSFPINIYAGHPIDFSTTPAMLQTAANLPSIADQHGLTRVKTIEIVGEEEFTEFASAPLMMQPLSPCSIDHMIRNERKNDIPTVDPLRQDICGVTSDSQLVHKVPHDWSDFLGLDGNNDLKFSEKTSKEGSNDYDDDDFEDFISHESKGRNVKNADCMTSSVESEILFNYNAKGFVTDVFAKVEHNLENQTNHEMKLNLDLFCDGMSLHKRNDVDQTLRKEGGQLTDCTWNSLIGQPEDGSQYAVEKISHADDNISFRSLEFKVSKPLSSTQTPDDSQSTSSATDLEKKSADNRSLSSLDLFHSNESNAATISSSNSLANNTTDPSPTFLFGSGKPLDAKEILNKMGGVIAADRYYDLTDHSQDSDSHAYQWTRCLKVVDKMVRQANEIFYDVVDSSAVVELFKIEKGLLYFKGLAEMFLVAARISFQMKASSISSEELVTLQKSVDAEWKKLSDAIPGEISSMFLPSMTLTSLDCSDRALRHLLVEMSDLDAYKWSCGLCLLRVADANPSSPAQTDVSSSSNRHGILLMSTDRLEYGGRSYHPQCANLWINCVDLTLPSLNIPELL